MGIETSSSDIFKLLQTRAAYSEDHSVQRNNFSLFKALASKWPTLAPPPEALLGHISAGGPQAASGAKGRMSRQFADRCMFGLRLASVGGCCIPQYLELAGPF